MIVTSEMVRAAWDVLPKKYSASVHDKRTSAVMKGAAWVVVAQGQQTHEQFMLYTTTLGTEIYTPFTPGEPDPYYSLAGQLGVLGHELRHVQQFLADPVRFMERYARDTEERTVFECEGYRTGETIRRHLGLTGTTPDLLAGHLKSYGATANNIALARRFHEISFASLQPGVFLDEPARDVVLFVEAHAAGRAPVDIVKMSEVV